jgi:serine/threonine-protein kinase RsbW
VLDLRLASTRESVDAARLAVGEHLRPLALDAGTLYRVELVLEEVLMNLVWHAVGERPDVVLGLRVEADAGRIVLRFDDPGPAFDPTRPRPAPHPSSLQEAQVGGLGITLVQSFARRLHWERRDGRNHLTVEIDRPAG